MLSATCKGKSNARWARYTVTQLILYVFTPSQVTFIGLMSWLNSTYCISGNLLPPKVMVQWHSCPDRSPRHRNIGVIQEEYFRNRANLTQIFKLIFKQRYNCGLHRLPEAPLKISFVCVRHLAWSSQNHDRHSMGNVLVYINRLNTARRRLGQRNGRYPYSLDTRV